MSTLIVPMDDLDLVQGLRGRYDAEKSAIAECPIGYGVPFKSCTFETDDAGRVISLDKSSSNKSAWYAVYNTVKSIVPKADMDAWKVRASEVFGCYVAFHVGKV